MYQEVDMPQMKDCRAIVLFKGDTGKYELDYDFQGEVGNLVNLEDLALSVQPTGKYRILDKNRVAHPGESPVVTYTLEKF
jgi:hypothetical protein